MGELLQTAIGQEAGNLRFTYPGRNSREYSPQKNREAPV